MTAEALAIVFSPNLLRAPHNDFSMILANMGSTHQLVKAIIMHVRPALLPLYHNADIFLDSHVLFSTIRKLNQKLIRKRMTWIRLYSKKMRMNTIYQVRSLPSMTIERSQILKNEGSIWYWVSRLHFGGHLFLRWFFLRIFLQPWVLWVLSYTIIGLL